MASILSLISALIFNLISWACSFIPFKCCKKKDGLDSAGDSSCILISGPGGFEQLKMTKIPDGSATVGYNMREFCSGPYTPSLQMGGLPRDAVVVRTHYFGINFADIAIRWGLYESALRYVGWPIVPGFDVAGEVHWAGPESGFKKGDRVFGYTMFGGYSKKVLVPSRQIRSVPSNISMAEACGLPAICATALHALYLAGFWPVKPLASNKSVLIHSAAGGVGSMLVQMCKLLGCSPIVGVVGRKEKVEFCKSLGADFVIDKQSCKDIWKEAHTISPQGFGAIFDANGVETLSSSFSHLSMCGRLVVYGFHTNLPKSAYLSPWGWLKLAIGQIRMPRFDLMEMVMDNKAVMGFNLSFLADEHELIAAYMKQILEWVEGGHIRVAAVTTFAMEDIAKAHAAIQSGNSVGKIVVSTLDWN